MLIEAGKIGVAGIELNTGNWSTAPHCDLPTLLESADARQELLGKLRENNLELVALNCNGNPLHPTDKGQDQVLSATIKLSGLLGLETVCTMSGLPGGGPNETLPNWVVTSWPLENLEMLRFQWGQAIPYWKQRVSFASDHGVRRFALELHAAQLVYNVPSLLRLRDAVGPAIGANLDPSHLMWMGADPLAAATALGSAIHHIHAKDTLLEQDRLATISRLDNNSSPAERSWNYVTLGYGHSESWWKTFCYRLKLAGYDGWLSIEHEDPNMPALVGLRKSVELLRSAILN
jgi:sugar phosphate isomerase/epimerase